MRIFTPEQYENQLRLIRERKERLKAEGKCIDCKAPKGERFVRCLRCRVEHRERVRRTAEKKCRAGRINPNHLRNALTLRSELLYDDGLDSGLREMLLEAISQWKKQVAA